MINDEIITFLTESNAIEGEYNTSWLLDNSVRAWEYLLTQEKLTKENILKTHNILMEDKLANHLRGKFRTVDVRVGTKICPPWQGVQRAVKKWIEAANLTIQLPTEKTGLEQIAEEIKKDHIVFESIHPFIDGNGRTGRIILNWQRVKVGLPILIIYEDERWKYYDWFR
jgi:Fic family protein